MLDTRKPIFPVDVQDFIHRGQCINCIFSQIFPGSLKMSCVFGCTNYSSNAAMMQNQYIVGGLSAYRYILRYCKMDTCVQSRSHQLHAKGIYRC